MQPTSARTKPASKTITAEQLCAAFILDAPVPVRHLYGLYGQRSTFAAWKVQGLDIRKLDGLGPSVIPSELKTFLIRKWGTFAPRTE